MAWFGALAALSATMFAIVALGRPDTQLFPTSLSSAPGGALALHELLIQSGVEVERHFSPPRRSRTDIGAVLIFDRSSSAFGDVELSPSDILEDVRRDFPNASSFIVASTTGELRSADLTPIVKVTTDLDGLKQIESLACTPRYREQIGAAILLWTNDQNPMVSFLTHDEKMYLFVHDGSMFVNRFLAKGDNASLAVTLAKAFTPEGKKLALPEYLYGVQRSENLFTKLGPAFSATLVQLLLMFVLAVYSLGKRFGYPEVEIPRKPGAARYFGALGAAFRKGRSTDIVLEVALQRALRIASRKFALSAELTPEQRLQRIPGPLGDAMRAIFVLAPTKPRPDQAADLLRQLEICLKEIS